MGHPFRCGDWGIDAGWSVQAGAEEEAAWFSAWGDRASPCGGGAVGGDGWVVDRPWSGGGGGGFDGVGSAGDGREREGELVAGEAVVQDVHGGVDEGEAIGIRDRGGGRLADEADDAGIGDGGGGERFEVRTSVAFEPLDTHWVFACLEGDFTGGAGIAAAGVQFDAGVFRAIAGCGDGGGGEGIGDDAGELRLNSGWGVRNSK